MKNQNLKKSEIFLKQISTPLDINNLSIFVSLQLINIKYTQSILINDYSNKCNNNRMFVTNYLKLKPLPLNNVRLSQS